MTNTLGYSIILYFSLINKQLVYLAGLFQKNSYGITPELFSEFVVRTGLGVSPEMGITMELVGRERCIARIEKTIKYLKEKAASQTNA